MYKLVFCSITQVSISFIVKLQANLRAVNLISCIWDKDFCINFRCWKMSSYIPHVRRVACDDVTISRALLLYKIAFILLGSSLKQ